MYYKVDYHGSVIVEAEREADALQKCAENQVTIRREVIDDVYTVGEEGLNELAGHPTVTD